MYAVVGTNVCILSEKTKFQVNFFNIFPKSTLNTLGVIFACPLRPVSGGGQSVRGVCKNCTPGIRVSAMPASGPCSRIRYPGSGRPQWLVPAFCRRQCLLSGLPAAAVSGLTITGAARRPAILLRPLSGISCFGCRPVTLLGCHPGSRALAAARSPYIGRSLGSRALAAGAARYPARRCRVRQVRQKCIP